MLLYAAIVHSFSLLNSIPLFGCITIYVYMYLLMDIWVVSNFCLLKAAVNICISSLYGFVPSLVLGRNLGVEWQDHGTHMCSFFRNCQTVSKVIISFYSPLPAVYKHANSFTFRPTLSMISLFKNFLLDF